MNNQLHNKKLISFIIIFIIVINLNPANANRLSTNNKILYVGGNEPGNYTKIQYAIENATAGDTIFVYVGKYYENIFIDKPLTITGENRNNTIIDGNYLGDTVTINAEGIIFQNFTIINGKTNNSLDIAKAGIRITGSNNVIKGNIIRDNQLGIFGLRVTNLTICNNHFFNNGITFSPYENYERACIYKKYFIHTIENNSANGKNIVYLKNEKDFEIKTKNVGQIIAVNCTNISIQNISISDTDYAILLAFCSYCIIENSNITYNDGIWTFYSKYNIFRYNNLSNNFVHGITLDYFSNYNIIENNIISNNQMAGVMIEYHSKKNLIQNNNLINNEWNAYFTQAFRNKWNNNYWSDWQGLENKLLRWTSKIIIGRIIDKPKPVPIWFNFDRHPSEKIFEI